MRITKRELGSDRSRGKRRRHRAIRVHQRYGDDQSGPKCEKHLAWCLRRRAEARLRKAKRTWNSNFSEEFRSYREDRPQRLARLTLKTKFQRGLGDLDIQREGLTPAERKTWSDWWRELLNRPSVNQPVPGLVRLARLETEVTDEFGEWVGGSNIVPEGFRGVGLFANTRSVRVGIDGRGLHTSTIGMVIENVESLPAGVANAALQEHSAFNQELRLNNLKRGVPKGHSLVSYSATEDDCPWLTIVKGIEAGKPKVKVLSRTTYVSRRRK